MKRHEIGVMVNNLERDRLKAFRVAAELGFHHVHTSGLPENWLTGPQRAQYVASARASAVEIGTMFIAFDGQSYADRDTIARTVGLANPATRAHRCQVAQAYIELALELGVPTLAAHIGFLPQERDRGDYKDLVHSVQTIADCCARQRLGFHLETGQEPAEVLCRFLADVNRPNVAINFDPANFILYGTDEPVSALGCLAAWVRGVHCKDGLWPEQPGTLGREVPIGHGAVNFPAFLQKLISVAYRAPLVIEREQGSDKIRDIEIARGYLLALLGESGSKELSPENNPDVKPNPGRPQR
jgi:sugar phosphate isomerase/epimerase